MVYSFTKEQSENSLIYSLFDTYSRGTRQEKGKVCFGSGLERKTLEADTRGLVSRHARKHIRIPNELVGPSTYDHAAHISAMSSLMNKPTSILGTVLGGRKAERKFFKTTMQTPAPGQYTIPSLFPSEIRQSCVPFNSTTERTMKFNDVPGVGTYNVGVYKKRRADFKHSFGGPTCLQPSVKMKCGPFNFDVCDRCKKFPEGDYWYFHLTEADKLNKSLKIKQDATGGIFLCRMCYDTEKKENKIFTALQMLNFKKIRDCSKVHFHDGCKQKLFIVPPQEIAKLNEKEGYLSLYYN